MFVSIDYLCSWKRRNVDTMAFKEGMFGHHEHQVYKSTFLRKVEGEIEVDGESWSKREGGVGLFKEYVGRQFGIDLGGDYKGDGAVIKSKDGNIRYTFVGNRAMVSIGRGGYVSFDDSFRGVIEKLSDFGGSMARGARVRKLMMRKENVMPMAMPESGGSLRGLLGEVLRSEHADMLLAGCVKGNDFEEVDKGIRTDIGDGGRIVRLIGYEYTGERRVDVRVTITAVYEPEGGMDAGDIVARAEEINQMMFDAFMDTVTPGVEAIMRED